jgi:AraC family transcriptional regulator
MKRGKVAQNTALEYRKRICRAMDYISRNLDRDLSLQEIARAAPFSKFHFHRIFKAAVGETVAEFTRRLRLERAANRLVASSRDNITKIAVDCGFSSSQNFAKAFRQHFGVTPTAYRNSKKGNKAGKRENAWSLQAMYKSDIPFIGPVNNERNAMNGEVREMPEYHVAYVRKMGPYGKETCKQAFGELTAWAAPRGYLGKGVMLGVYWDNPEVTPPDRCRVDMCVPIPIGTVPDRPVAVQIISGGPYAVCHFEVDLDSDSFQQAWDDAFAWLVDGGYECDDKPCYELYQQSAADHPEGKFVFDICIPLKRER